MKRAGSKSNLFDSEGQAKPSGRRDDFSGGRSSQKLSSNALESNALGGWASPPLTQGMQSNSDIFDLLPGHSRANGKSRRDSFDYPLPVKSSGKDGPDTSRLSRSTARDQDSSVDNSLGDKRRRKPSASSDRLDPPDKLLTVAQLRTMKSFSGIDSSSPIAPLTKLKSIKSLTEIAGGMAGMSPRRNSYLDDNSKDKNRGEKRSGVAAASARDSVQAAQDHLDRSGHQDGSLESQLIQERKHIIKSKPGPSIKSLQPGKSSSGFNLKMLMRPSGPCLISDHIALGGREDANDRILLKNLGVTHVLNVAQQLPNFHEGSFVYLKLPIIDSPDVDLLPFVKPALAFLNHVESINGRVLVHCIAGVSRSVSLIIMHLISSHKICLASAYSHVKAMRGIIHPNDGFKAQLAKFELAELGYSSIISKSVGSDWDIYSINSIRPHLASKSSGGPTKRVPTRSERFGKKSQSNNKTQDGTHSSQEACCVVS